MHHNEPQTLVALTTVATPALTVSAKVTEGLLEYDYDIKPSPSLATEWTISPDGQTYTFKLRPNVKFHDGKPFTSADVAYSIQHAEEGPSARPQHLRQRRPRSRRPIR